MAIRTNLNNASLQNGSGSLLGLYSVEIGTFTEVVQIQYLDITKNTKVLYYSRIREYFHFRVNLSNHVITEKVHCLFSL